MEEMKKYVKLSGSTKECVHQNSQGGINSWAYRANYINRAWGPERTSAYKALSHEDRLRNDGT